MSYMFSEFRKNQNIRPLVLPNKEKFYMDLRNVGIASFSGREDIWGFGNTFIFEAEQLIVNAIELFEMGYFDCAYYSLRSCVEVSTVIVFLSDMPEDEREAYFEAWRDSKDFPMIGKMMKQLSEQGNVFADMKEKMKDFFSDTRDLKGKLNKYVHKQGFRHFYVSRNHPLNSQLSQDTFISNFEHYIKRCIGVVAVMRLVIDPFPILLMDEEILYRSVDSFTEPYSEEFAEGYIGENTLKAYKTTDIYEKAYEFFIKEERKTPAVLDVIKWKYINIAKIDEILKQHHLLSKHDVVCILMVYNCEKIVKVYRSIGFPIYSTDRKTNRTDMSRSSYDFKNFLKNFFINFAKAKAEDKINQPYGEAFISAFIFDDEPYFVEHNEILTPDDIAKICVIDFGAISKMNENMEVE